MTAWERTMVAHRDAEKCQRIIGRKLTDGEYISIVRLSAAVFTAAAERKSKPTSEWYASQPTKIVNGQAYCIAEVLSR